MSANNGTSGPDIPLLAELDAGLLDADRARQLRAAASADPAATAVLDALAATRSELAAAPTPEPPPGAAARWAAALESARHDESPSGEVRTSTNRPVRPPTPTPHRRWTPPLIAAALLTLLVSGAALWPEAQPTRIAGVELAAAGRAAVGSTDLGALADPTRRAGCLRAVAASDATPDPAPGGRPDPDPAVIGGRRVEFDGRPGVLLVLSTGERGVFRVIVVDPACGPAGGTLLGATTVGR